MRIILSPSKTKVLKGNPTSDVFHRATTARIIASMQNLSVVTLSKALHINEVKAAALHEFYTHYETMPTGAAGDSYTGLAFKNLNWPTFSAEDKVYGEKHLVILSALYGIVIPNSPIKEYRLDLIDPVLRTENTNLYEVWSESVNQALREEDWLLNLASKEYSSLLQHPRMVTILFTEEKNGKTVQLSTTAKQLRGRMARHVIEQRICEPENLPVHFEGFTRLYDNMEETIIIKEETNMNSYTITYHKDVR